MSTAAPNTSAGEPLPLPAGPGAHALPAVSTCCVSVGEVRAALARMAVNSPDHEELAMVACALLTRLDTIRDEARMHGLSAARAIGRANDSEGDRVRDAFLKMCGTWGERHDLLVGPHVLAAARAAP